MNQNPAIGLRAKRGERRRSLEEATMTTFGWLVGWLKETTKTVATKEGLLWLQRYY